VPEFVARRKQLTEAAVETTTRISKDDRLLRLYFWFGVQVALPLVVAGLLWPLGDLLSTRSLSFDEVYAPADVCLIGALVLVGVSIELILELFLGTVRPRKQSSVIWLLTGAIIGLALMVVYCFVKATYIRFVSPVNGGVTQAMLGTKLSWCAWISMSCGILGVVCATWVRYIGTECNAD
jgi:hypothetical protein